MKIEKADPEAQSKDLVGENISKLKELFPEILTEGKIDFTALQEILGEEVETGDEFYRFTWAGKAQARREAHKPSTGILRPCKEESVDWDKTENLYIEGDNLEVLKLLQKSYAGKVKMIYIDPPYNTGKDFVYKDNYKDNLRNYQELTGQVDSNGNKVSTNSDSDGRYHSNWLNMIYPRLRLARNLLSQEGVILISIDDNELYNLRKVCDEVFGEDHWLGTVIWKNATDNNPTQISIEHEYILAYSKNKAFLSPVWRSKISDVKELLIRIGDDFNSKYPDSEELQKQYTSWFREHKNELWPLDRYKYIDSDGVYTGSQSVHNPGREGYRYDVIHPVTKKPCKQPLMGYRFPFTTMKKMIEDGKILFGDNENKIIELKLYASEFSEKLGSILEFDGRIGSYDLKNIFEDSKRIFTNPKPVKFLAQIFDFVLEENDILLDFYSGSSSSAHSVLYENAKDLGKRKFIQIQLPELTGIKSEANKTGYNTIAEIGKERIRRAAKKIAEEHPEKAKNLDLGFKVFKLDTSNISAWDGTPDNLKKELFDSVSNIKDDRTEEDVLYEILLKYGLDLTLPVKSKEITGKQVYSIGYGALFICLADNITKEISEGIVTWKEELNPEICRVVFKDSGFQSDADKSNAVQTLKRFGVTEIKSI